MKINQFLAGTLVGIVTGAAVAYQCNKRDVSPEQALHNVKKELKNTFDIEGSWIQMIPETMETDLLNYTVYRGGITSRQNNRIHHYDFAVDTKTGAILELK